MLGRVLQIILSTVGERPRSTDLAILKPLLHRYRLKVKVAQTMTVVMKTSVKTKKIKIRFQNDYHHEYSKTGPQHDLDTAILTLPFINMYTLEQPYILPKLETLLQFVTSAYNTPTLRQGLITYLPRARAQCGRKTCPCCLLPGGTRGNNTQAS